MIVPAQVIVQWPELLIVRTNDEALMEAMDEDRTELERPFESSACIDPCIVELFIGNEIS
jgi:hypothetical protein